MSNHPNHRRGEARRQDNGPRWENVNPTGQHGVALGRSAWKRIGARSERRTGERSKAFYINGGRPSPRPESEDGD